MLLGVFILLSALPRWSEFTVFIIAVMFSKGHDGFKVLFAVGTHRLFDLLFFHGVN